MARPQSDRVIVRPVRSRRLTPWGMFWRAFDPQTGKRERQSAHYATEAEALAEAAQIERLLTRIRPAARTAAPVSRVGGVTLGEHITEWLDTIVTRRKASSEANYRSLMKVNVIEQDFGDLVLATFGAHEVTSIVRIAEQRGLAWSSQRLLIDVISAAMDWAVKWKRLAANPCDKLARELKPSTAVDRGPNPLTFAEMEAFLQFLRTGTLPKGYDATHTRRLDEDEQPVDNLRPRRPRSKRYRGLGWTRHFPAWYPFFLVLFHTGVRRGEATGLTWDRVFLDGPRPYIRIDRTFSTAARRAAQRGNRQQPIDGLVPPKTKASTRKVWLSPPAAAVLRELARGRRKLALQEKREPSPFVFLGPVSRQRVQPTMVDRVFATVIMAIGLGGFQPSFTVHDTRDTFATVHLQKLRSPLGWVSKMLGHVKKSMTLDRYSRFLPDEESIDHAASLTTATAAEPAAKVAPVSRPAAAVRRIDTILASPGRVLTSRRAVARR